MNTPRIAALGLGILAGASEVNAQAGNGTGTWKWQVSVDRGTSWRSGVVRVAPAQQDVRCRVLLGWSQDAGYAFAGCQFDAFVTGVNGAGAGDSVTGMVRPLPRNSSTQTLAATRFGSVIKIDDSRDSTPPGYGTRAVFPGQVPEDFAQGQFTTANPVSIFEFDLNLDGSIGRRTLDQRFVTGATQDFPIIRLYTASWGAQNDLVIMPPSGGQVSFTTAEIAVVTCPADVNDDGQLDFFDYLDFVAALAAGEAAADFNNDGQVDFFDYLDFTGAFGVGCE